MNKGNLVFCNREEAVSRMNLWGSERRSFFFLIDFDGEKCLVEETSKLSSEDLLSTGSLFLSRLKNMPDRSI